MVSLKKRTIWVLGMAFSLIVIMIYGSKNSEVLQESINNELLLDSLIKSDSEVKLKRNLVEEAVTLTLGLPESPKQSPFFEQFVRWVKAQSNGKVEMEPRLVSQDISEQLLTGVINGDIDIALM